MSATASRRGAFRRRLRARAHLLGTFVKTPSPHATEIIGGIGFDFAILDAEHAPLDRATLDLMVMAAWATDLPTIVRVAEPGAGAILSALDCGATGVMVPHVRNEVVARDVAAACRYQDGGRGFSNTTRAGRYGQLGMARHVAEADASTVCVAMIEDIAALDALDAIMSTPGIDAIFIGRGDLSAAMGAEAVAAGRLRDAVTRITAAARRADLPVMVLPSDRADADAMDALGATAFVLSNDQSLLALAAKQALDAYAKPSPAIISSRS